MKNLNEFSKQIHAANVEKGFYDKPREIGTALMLIVSELGEAIAADQKGRYTTIDKTAFDLIPQAWKKQGFEKNVKDTFEDEIADSVIRLLDLCGHMEIDIDWHIGKKLEYNRSREKRHGKKY